MPKLNICGEIMVPKLVRDTDRHEEFRHFPQPFQVNTGVTPQNMTVCCHILSDTPSVILPSTARAVTYSVVK
jgi:hypothetical protein